MVSHYHTIPYMVMVVQTNKPVIDKIMITELLSCCYVDQISLYTHTLNAQHTHTNNAHTCAHTHTPVLSCRKSCRLLVKLVP